MNFIKPGHVVTLTAPTDGVVAGTCYLIGALLVFAKTTAAEGEKFEGATDGVYENAPKTTGQSWAEGAKVYWDNTGKKFTTTATSNTLVGVILSAQASADTIGTVKLNGTVV